MHRAEKPGNRLAAMPGRLRIPVLACTLALALLLVGCGSGEGGTIPSEDADNLVRLLDAIENDLASQNCEVVDDHVGEFASEVNSLPSEVDDEVEKGLTQASARLIELSRQPGQCEEVTGATGVTGTESTPSTTTTEESTTSSTTTSTSTTTEPEEEEPPADQDQDDEGGDEPIETPGGGGDGTGGRSSDSGGLEGGKGPS